MAAQKIRDLRRVAREDKILANKTIAIVVGVCYTA